MKAIQTRYIGPTSHRPARILATDGDGNRITIPAEVEDWGRIDDAHARGALALCTKMGWDTEAGLVHGRIGILHVFCFLTPDRRTVVASKPGPVWILTEETEPGRSHGFPDKLTVGVYATEAAARQDQERWIAKLLALGKRVCGHIPEGDDDPDDWEVDIDVEEWPLLTQAMTPAQEAGTV